MHTVNVNMLERTSVFFGSSNIITFTVFSSSKSSPSRYYLLQQRDTPDINKNPLQRAPNGHDSGFFFVIR